jgi:pyridoxine 5-phosphate synthase
MPKLSVNVNKVATLRNARGGRVPSVIQAVNVCLDAGAHGITVHHRADERHIRRADVFAVADVLRARRSVAADAPEFNIEGDPRPDLIETVLAVRPDQCTLVPVMPGEITSQAGWPPAAETAIVAPAVARLRQAGVRVSLFIDPTEAAVDWAHRVGADRVELYTEPYARAFEAGPEQARESCAVYATAARAAAARGLGVNAGHDLDLDNLPLFSRLPHLAEVSIGHALISHALWVGLDRSVKDFLAALRARPVLAARAGLKDDGPGTRSPP